MKKYKIREGSIAYHICNWAAPVAFTVLMVEVLAIMYLLSI